jgi:hypothetical protein
MNEDQAQRDGFDAYLSGAKCAANPHSAWDVRVYDAWFIGWLDARDQSTKLRPRRGAKMTRPDPNARTITPTKG